MRRTKKSILAVAATAVMMLAVTAGPAMAADNNDHHDNRVDNRASNQLTRFDNQLDRLNNPLLVGGLFNDEMALNSGLVSDFDHGFVGGIDHIDNGFMVDNDHSFVGDIDR
jgi:hypothetical protein